MPEKLPLLFAGTLLFPVYWVSTSACIQCTELSLDNSNVWVQSPQSPDIFLPISLSTSDRFWHHWPRQSKQNQPPPRLLTCVFSLTLSAPCQWERNGLQTVWSWAVIFVFLTGLFSRGMDKRKMLCNRKLLLPLGGTLDFLMCSPILLSKAHRAVYLPQLAKRKTQELS